MAIPKGLFDEISVADGWFDETKQSVGWFDHDLLDSGSAPPTFNPAWAVSANVVIQTGACNAS